MKILFVCTGNTCRSPMAEGIYNIKADVLGLPRAESAGIYAVSGIPAAENAVRAAAEFGADISGHRSREVTEDMMAASDIVVCMTPAHIAALSTMYPEYAGKLRLLGDEGISDPYGGDLAEYMRCAAMIDKAAGKLIREVGDGN